MGWERRNADFCKAQTDAQMAYVEAEREVGRLEDENAKLRELLARADRARRDLCDAYPDAETLNCEECPAWGSCKGDIADGMRELGIEVDE